MSTGVKLITRGDDAASARSANLAIREAFEGGILRNASVLACTDLLDHAYECLGSLQGLCIGLHATIACEWLAPRWRPVLPPDSIPGLAGPDGFLRKSPGDVANAGVPVETIMLEISAQLDRLAGAGFKPSYLDLHMSFGWIRGVDGAMDDFCRRKGLINGYRGYQRLPETKEDGGCIAKFIAAAEIAEPGIYILVGHPAYDDDEMAGFVHHPPHSPPGPERDLQRRLFLDPEVVSLARTGRIRPIRYDETASR